MREGILGTLATVLSALSKYNLFIVSGSGTVAASSVAVVSPLEESVCVSACSLRETDHTSEEVGTDRLSPSLPGHLLLLLRPAMSSSEDWLLTSDIVGTRTGLSGAGWTDGAAPLICIPYRCLLTSGMASGLALRAARI